MTVEQLVLDAQPEVSPRDLTIPERCEQFHRANPHVLAEAARVARFFLSRGQRPSIDRIWCELRERLVTTGDSFRLNQDYRAFYARLLMATWPEAFDGVFEVRSTPLDREYDELVRRVRALRPQVEAERKERMDEYRRRADAMR